MQQDGSDDARPHAAMQQDGSGARGGLDALADLPRLYQEEGHAAGLEAGRERAFQEGYAMGWEEAAAWGGELGTAARRLCDLAAALTGEHEEAPFGRRTAALCRKVQRALADVAAFPLDNGEDGEKGAKADRIRAAIRELGVLAPPRRRKGACCEGTSGGCCEGADGGGGCEDGAASARPCSDRHQVLPAPLIDAQRSLDF